MTAIPLYNPSTVSGSGIFSLRLIPFLAESAPAPVPAAPAEWLDRTLESLRQLADLPSNWDSYGANSISHNSIAHTSSVLNDLAKTNAPPVPTITASPDGNAACCWDTGDYSLDIEVLPDGLIKYSFVDFEHPNNDKDGYTREVQVMTDRLSP